MGDLVLSCERDGWGLIVIVIVVAYGEFEGGILESTDHRPSRHPAQITLHIIDIIIGQ